MKTTAILKLLPSLATTVLFSGVCAQASEDAQARMRHLVDDAIRPVMERHGVPGVAVGVTVDGKHHFFNYGVASKESGQKVDEDTLFEIGSLSKTFTATLAAYAQETGALSLTDAASRHQPELAGTRFDKISLVELGTYAAGGLPLQVPDEVTDATLIDYYRTWQPEYEPGTHRRYSNPSIGLFGHLAARSMDASFDDLMEDKLLPMLGLTNTYINVPEDRMGRYAFGYNKEAQPVRVNPGIWDSEAYGIKTSASDLTRFLDTNMDGADLDPALRRAIASTHAGYYQVGGMIQGLGWEIYPHPTGLDRLRAGNSAEIMFKANKVETFASPRSAQDGDLINKTGSTNGFGAYAVFLPSERTGVVILANRNYPVSDRISAGFEILNALVRAEGSDQ
jgi:beta-lactamase class C